MRFCTGNQRKELCSFSHTRHLAGQLWTLPFLPILLVLILICSSPCDEGFIPHPVCEARLETRRRTRQASWAGAPPPACSGLHKLAERFRVFIRFLHHSWAWVRIPIREPSNVLREKQSSF